MQWATAVRTLRSDHGASEVLKANVTRELSVAVSMVTPSIDCQSWTWFGGTERAMSTEPSRMASSRVFSSVMKSSRIVETSTVPPHHASLRSSTTWESGANSVTTYGPVPRISACGVPTLSRCSSRKARLDTCRVPGLGTQAKPDVGVERVNVISSSAVAFTDFIGA
jgi:hypothetical protein